MSTEMREPKEVERIIREGQVFAARVTRIMQPLVLSLGEARGRKLTWKEEMSVQGGIMSALCGINHSLRNSPGFSKRIEADVCNLLSGFTGK